MSKVVYIFGDDISTDAIYPGRYMATVLPTETPQFCFADYTELNKKLVSKEYPAESVIIGGHNFGCGSSREQAASTILGHGLVVIAKNYARIFLQNAINLGLNLITCPDIEADLGDEIELKGDKVFNKTKGKEFSTIPLPAARMAIVEAGGLIPYTRKKVVQKYS
ncbi:MAG TPA: 3-isopropylmalate dehydratase [Ignavibacteria bacterium]|nr:3-isopropylmalate dehydratase [Ignavibacteria bacterium]